MNNIIGLVLILILSSCSKSENNRKIVKLEQPSMIIELGPVTISTNPSLDFPSSSVDFSSVSFQDKVIQELIIKNTSANEALIFSNEDFNTLNLSPFIIESNLCLNSTVSPRQSCSIKVSIANNTSLLTNQNISSVLEIKGSDVFLSAILQLDPTDYNAPISDILVSPLNLNFGLVKAGSFKDLNIIVKNLSKNVKEIALTSISNSNISVVSNSCAQLPSRKSCVIKLRYLSSVDEIVNNSNLLKIANNQVNYSVNSYIPTINNPEIITSLDPVVLSRQIDLNQPASETGIANFINNGISTFPGIIVGKSSHSSISITNIDCSSGLSRGRSCSVQYSIDSAIAPVGITNQYVWIQSGTIASEKHTLNLNIVPVNCTPENSGIANVLTVSGNINSGCFVETCSNEYVKVENACLPIGCNLDNSLDNGINSMSEVLTVSGTIQNNSCQVTSCSQYYSISGDLKSCSPQTVTCSPADAVQNGWTITHAASYSGNRVGNSVSNCNVSLCNLNYEIIGKTCSPISCTTGNANILNAASVSGNIVDGCIVDSCQTNYSKENNQCNFLANISILSGNNQAQVYSSLLPNPFVAEVKTPAGVPMVGVPVTWSVITNNGTLSNVILFTDGLGRVSSNYTLGSNPGSNTVRVLVDTTSSFVNFNSTGNLSPFNKIWGFDVGTSLEYDLSGSVEFSNGKVSLKQIDQLDDSNTALGFGAATIKGLAWDGSLLHMRLSSDSVCNGSLTNCSELASDWTPKQSNLIGHWKFNNNLNATVGNDGTASGTPVFSPNLKMGTHTLSTSGGNQAVDVGEISQLNSVNKFTISGWFLQNTLDVRGGLFAKLKDASNMIRARTWEDGNLYSYVYNGSVSYSYFDYSTVITAGKWFHYSMVFDGTQTGNASRLKVFIDGNEITQLFVGTIPSSTSNLLGSDFEISENSLHFGSTTASLNGKIDEFAIWNNSLTSLEIKRIYDIQKTRYSGNLISRSINSENLTGNWTDFSWRTNLPYFKGLPDFISGFQSETTSDYASISSNLMSGNVGLYHLDEAAGTTGANSVLDKSSALKHGTPVSTVFGEEGKIYRSARSNGGYITLGTSSNFRHTTQFSVSFWAKGSGNIMGAGASGGQGYGGFIVGSDASLSFTWTPSNPGSDRNFTCTQKGIPGDWNHYAMHVNFSGNTATCFINGIQSGGTTNLSVVTWTPVVSYNSGQTDSIGGRFINSWSPFVGSYDEVAIWNRALVLNEARQIYRRGANRIKFQVRSCSTESCSGVSWQGPDNTPNTYFSEIHNITNQSVNPTGIIGITFNRIFFTNFSNLVSNNQYFQYKAIFENEDVNSLCSYGNCSPELSSVQVAPLTRYSTMNPFVVNNVPVSFYLLNSFTQTLGTSCSSGISYNISLDKSTWYYHNGSSWVVSSNTAQSNDAATINSNLSTIPNQIGTGSFYFKAFLKSNGSSTCELDQVQISGEQ